MTRGRPKKSAALKLAQGNAGRRTVGESAQSERGRPQCPPKVVTDPIAREMWEWAIDELDRMGLLTLTDRLAVEILARNYSRMLKADESIAELGIVLEGEKGGQYMNPAIGVYNAAEGKVARMMTELGLTPRSREQLNAAPQGEKTSGLSGFIARNPAKKKAASPPAKPAKRKPAKKAAKKRPVKKRAPKRK